MIELTVHVIAHEKRREVAKNLAEKVEADHVWEDNGWLGEWRNHMRAWKNAADSDATHAVVLQDDALPVDDFRKHVEKAVEFHPDDLISLYVGTHRPRKQEVLRCVALADERGASWLSADTLMWGVGVVVPTALIPEILHTIRRSRLPYDQRIGLWAEKTGRDVFYTWPSLVDHLDEPTVVKGRTPGQGVRKAHRVGIPEWNEYTVRIERVDHNFVGSTKDRA